MKNTYPIVLTKFESEDGYLVYVPDFDINTQGEDITDAIEMARDAIGIMGIDKEDDKKEIPTASEISNIKHEKDDIVTLVDVDFTEYRRKNDLKTVKKNCTLPSWLAYDAEKQGINFSQVLQKALKDELNIV